MPEVITEMAEELVFKEVGAWKKDWAKIVALTEYFAGPFPEDLPFPRKLSVLAGGDWRTRSVSDTEMQGLVQVAFAADKIEASWDDSNFITRLSCWKTLTVP